MCTELPESVWSEVWCDLRRDTLTELTLAAVMGLNPNAPEWTPERNSSGERMKVSTDRRVVAAHDVGTHQNREEGVESDGVGVLHLPVKQDKYLARNHRQLVCMSIAIPLGGRSSGGQQFVMDEDGVVLRPSGRREPWSGPPGTRLAEVPGGRLRSLWRC